MLPTLPDNEKKQTLFSRDFILLFCMAMCNNSYMAVFYCFEQWLEGLQVSPNWRGILLSALFAMVLLWRPLASIVLLSRSKLPALLVTICLSSCIMLAYPFIHGPDSIWLILGLRIAQGISLAVYSSCVVAVLVSCIPKGQSARGFAIFSLTTLLPYSIIPAVGEQILPLLGGEPRLFALMAVLAIPALCMLVPLAPKLRKPEISADTARNQMTPRAILYSMTHSGLGCIYLACLSFSIMTALAIYFMKGLCVTTGATPAMFFMGYTTTIILVRLFGGHVLDTLPGNRNVRANAAAFDRILSNADGQTAAYLNGLSGMTPEGAAETLRQVSGENTLNSGYANINQLNLFREGIRNGVKGLAPTDEPRSQMWITALGGISNQGSNDSISGFDSYTGGLAAGYALTMSKALVGVGLAYIDTDVYSRDDLNHTDMRSWVGSLYAALDLDPVRLEADVMYGQGYNESETSFSGLPDAEGDYNSYFWGFGARASYNFLFNEGATRLTPYVGIEYASVTQDAYTESGPLGRHFDVDRLERWTLPVGIELQHDFVIDDEKSISTCIGVGYARDLNDSQAEASVYLGPNSAPLRVHGVEMGKDALRYNAGVSFNVNDTVSIFGQYNGETRSNYTDNSFRLGVEIRF